MKGRASGWVKLDQHACRFHAHILVNQHPHHLAGDARCHETGALA